MSQNDTCRHPCPRCGCTDEPQIHTVGLPPVPDRIILAVCLSCRWFACARFDLTEHEITEAPATGLALWDIAT